MPDVFISYAREDEPFVDRLRAALKERGRDVWVDRGVELGEGIEPGDDWQRSAGEAIDRSDAFVFVLSASSLASTPCREELRVAESSNKRLVPVCIEEPDAAAEVPAALRALSWIMLRPPDDFEAGVDLLVRALDTDIEVVRQHTRILVRARAWALADRRASPLLRGEELRAAEDWLSRAATAGAPPTELQREFIVASRRAATRRQRIAVAGSLAVAAVAVALSIFAFVQREQARRQARLAESRQFAQSAEAELASDPERSVSLAARGVRIEATAQAVHALWSALTASRLRADLRGPSPVDSLAFSPDGHELAVGSDDGTVRLWRLTGRKVPSRQVLWTEGHGARPVTSLAFSHAGDVLVVARSSTTFPGSGCSVEVLHAATGGLERTLGAAGKGSCQRFAEFLGSTRLVAVGSENGTVQLWNVDGTQPPGRPVQMLSADDLPETGIATSADGRDLAVVALHAVRVIGPRNGPNVTITTSPSGIFNPSAVAFGPEGDLLISGEYDTEVYYVGGGTTSDLYAQDGSTQSAAWSPNGRVLAAAAGFIGVDVWSSSTRLLEVLHGSSQQSFRAVAFSTNGLLAGGSGDGSVRVWAPDPDLPDAATGVPAAFSLGSAGGAPAVHLAAFGDARAGLLVVDDSGRKVATLSPNGDGPFAVSAGGEVAFTRSGKVVVERLRTGRPVRTWSLSSASGSGAPSAIAISADGRTVATISGGTLTVLSPRERRTRTIQVGDSSAAALSMSPSGALVAVTVPSGVQILDTATLTRVRRASGVAAAFSTTGSLMAIQRPDLSISILRTTGWRAQATLQGEPAQATRLVFSPDDRLLAVLGDDGVLRVWDTSDGTLLATRQVIESSLVAQRTGVPAVVLTATGLALVADSVDSTLNAYLVCGRCFDATALLTEAAARLEEIKPVSAP